MREVTDPAGNTIVYDYDLLGRRTGQVDPDSGAWSYEYDSEGHQTMVEDGAGVQVHTSYDALGRPTGRRQDSSTGPLLVSWEYDAPGELGLVDRSIRHTPGGDWAIDVAGYDARNRPTGTTLTVPASAGGLAGSYTTGYVYDRADRVVATHYPAVGGLPAETVTTTYNTVGLPETMIGAEDYVWSMAYDDRGRPSVRASGDHADMVAQGWEYDTDGRLDRLMGATPAAGGLFNVVVDHHIDYDEVGNITQRESFLDGLAWRECFTHDDRNRMTDAFTVDVADTCDSGVRGEGAAGYDHTYVYSPDGRLTSQTRDGISPEPSVARTRGRRIGTRRPPRVTWPSSLPWRTAVRSGFHFPFGPATAATSCSISTPITCSPVPTARAIRPSRAVSARSTIAIRTDSGSAQPGNPSSTSVDDPAAGSFDGFVFLGVTRPVPARPRPVW